MGWSWHFLNHEISWALVQRIMADQAKVIDAEKEKQKKKVITEANVGDFLAGLLGSKK